MTVRHGVRDVHRACCSGGIVRSPAISDAVEVFVEVGDVDPPQRLHADVGDVVVEQDPSECGPGDTDVLGGFLAGQPHRRRRAGQPLLEGSAHACPAGRAVASLGLLLWLVVIVVEVDVVEVHGRSMVGVVTQEVALEPARM